MLLTYAAPGIVSEDTALGTIADAPDGRRLALELTSKRVAHVRGCNENFVLLYHITKK